MRHLIRSLSALVLLLAMAACDPITLETTTTLEALPPPDLPGPSSSTTTTASPPVTNDPSPYTYRGFLPNGADFRASVPGPREERMTLVEGVFFFQQADAGLIPVGEVRYAKVSPPVGVVNEPGVLRLYNTEWLVEIIFSSNVLDALGGDPAAEVARAGNIELGVDDGWPVIRLAAPFTWGHTGAATPSVRFESFLIGAGCSGLAVACAETKTVHLSSISDLSPGAQGMSQDQRDSSWIESEAPRHILDPNYLDPGPLIERQSADLIWTGEEMIVWGGRWAGDGETPLIDGATFNPETNEWRAIPRIPLDEQQATRAVWGDGEMIVVSPDGTFGYDSESDIWRELGQALAPPEFEDRMLYLDGRIYIWDRAFSMHRMDVRVGMWETIGAPDEIAGFTEGWAGVLRLLDEEVVAVTVRDGCEGRQLWRLSGDEWVGLPEVTLSTTTYADCSTANQAAAANGELVIWATESQPSAIYSFQDAAWRELAPVPLRGTEGASGPVPMDAAHFLVPRWGEAAIFDAEAGEWARVTLPGQGTDAEMVWTGEEILAWGIFETFDAWRWTPGQTVIGGDDTT